ncbi:MAG TPA: hypothetical protein PLW75_09205 [Hyphomicrobium sp.]|nr:hypothetical protein [Hyphomicrobium sp.]
MTDVRIELREKIKWIGAENGNDGDGIESDRKPVRGEQRGEKLDLYAILFRKFRISHLFHP